MVLSRVHRAAAAGFERGADDYEKGRPTYPALAIERLVVETGMGSDSVVVDVGAGTGKFTRLLVPSGATVVAVEPVVAMRAALAESVPSAAIHDGTADAMPVDDASADVVTVAQAFHWFATTEAVGEFARVLKPGGWLALIWNTRDKTSPWGQAIGALMDRLAGANDGFSRAELPETGRDPLETGLLAR